MITIDINDTDLMRIEKNSCVAQSFLGKPCQAITLYDGGLNQGYFKEKGEFSFIPTNSGVLNLNDRYAFGIRTDILIWTEGFCEGVESFWSWNTKNCECIMVSGNHKGNFQTKLIVKTEDLKPVTASNQNEEPHHSFVPIEDKMEFVQQEAERMRNNPTQGEERFKGFLDKYGIEYKFQEPVRVGYKAFILDFLVVSRNNPSFKGSKKRKIVFEIDGEYHNTKEQKTKDAARTKTLNGGAYKVIRISNKETESEATIKAKVLAGLSKYKETEIFKKLTTEFPVFSNAR